MEHIHLIGIGGTGLSAIARLLLESGYTVSGSDVLISPMAESLQAAGVQIEHGHRAENVRGADLVIRSSAIRDDNPEVLAALSAGIPVYKRADFLGRLMLGRVGIAVAGTHGKTTTTAMIAWMLSSLGQDPSYIIGGISKNLGGNAHSGKGQAFVIEADEYDRMFLGLRYKASVITNIEYDHPDCFPTENDYYQAFRDFARLAPRDGAVFVCTDNPQANRLLTELRAQEKPIWGYGIFPFGPRTAPDYQAEKLSANEKGGLSFTALLPSTAGGTSPRRVQVHLQVPGEHNVRNALAVLALADWLGLPVDQAAESLESYSGADRRFELLGEAEGVVVISDYGHHPTEIQATLAAARQRYPHRGIWAVWQPHTYTRTKALFEGFTHSFGDADHVLVTEVYPSREPVSTDFSSHLLVDAMQHPDARFAADLQGATSYLLDALRPGDVLIVLSAGDADRVAVEVLAGLSERKNLHA